MKTFICIRCAEPCELKFHTDNGTFNPNSWLQCVKHAVWIEKKGEHFVAGRDVE